MKFSRDGVAVLLHDADARAHDERHRAASRSARWAELAALDAGSWHRRAFRGEPLARLDDAAALLAVAAGCSPTWRSSAVPGRDRECGEQVARAVRRATGRGPARCRCSRRSRSMRSTPRRMAGPRCRAAGSSRNPGTRTCRPLAQARGRLAPRSTTCWSRPRAGRACPRRRLPPAGLDGERRGAGRGAARLGRRRALHRQPARVLRSAFRSFSERALVFHQALAGLLEAVLQELLPSP